MKIQKLEELYKKERKRWSEEHRIRIHRAVSWLKSADKYNDDANISFISAMNAANSCWGGLQEKDADAILRLCKNLSLTNSMTSIENIFRSADGGKWLTMLISNKHLYWQYWRYLEGEMDLAAFNQKAAAFKSYSIKAINNGKDEYLLKSSLQQCLSLRAQVFHGFSTYDSQANKEALIITARVLRKIVTAIVIEMIENPDKDWGRVPWTFGEEKKPRRNVNERVKMPHEGVFVNN